jgi:hypothetical protein
MGQIIRGWMVPLIAQVIDGALQVGRIPQNNVLLCSVATEFSHGLGSFSQHAESLAKTWYWRH